MVENKIPSCHYSDLSTVRLIRPELKTHFPQDVSQPNRLNTDFNKIESILYGDLWFLAL